MLDFRQANWQDGHREVYLQGIKGQLIATHSSVLAWRIPGTLEPGGLPSMGSHRVRHDWRNSSSSSSNEGIVLNKEVTWDDYLKHVTKDILREKFWEKCQLLLKFMLAILDLYLGARERKWKLLMESSRVHGILHARIRERVAFPFSTGSSQPRDWTQVSHIAGGFFTSWAVREA